MAAAAVAAHAMTIWTRWNVRPKSIFVDELALTLAEYGRRVVGVGVGTPHANVFDHLGVAVGLLGVESRGGSERIPMCTY